MLNINAVLYRALAQNNSVYRVINNLDKLGSNLTNHRVTLVDVTKHPSVIKSDNTPDRLTLTAMMANIAVVAGATRPTGWVAFCEAINFHPRYIVRSAYQKWQELKYKTSVDKGFRINQVLASLKQESVSTTPQPLTRAEPAVQEQSPRKAPAQTPPPRILPRPGPSQPSYQAPSTPVVQEQSFPKIAPPPRIHQRPASHFQPQIQTPSIPLASTLSNGKINTASSLSSSSSSHTNAQASTKLLTLDDLKSLIDILKTNITQQKNERKTKCNNEWKVELLEAEQTKIQNGTYKTTVDAIKGIEDACGRKRNSWHFWQEPHSVGEFKTLLADLKESIRKNKGVNPELQQEPSIKLK